MVGNSVIKAWKRQTLAISGAVHYLLKNYAASIGQNIQDTADKILKEGLNPKRANLYIDDKDFDSIEKLAWSRNLPEAALIKEAIAEYLAKHSQS